MLELPHDRGAEVRNRRADSRKHRLVMREDLLAIVEVRLTALQIDGELEGVQDFDLVPSLLRGLFQPSGAVALGTAREDR